MGLVLERVKRDDRSTSLSEEPSKFETFVDGEMNSCSISLLTAVVAEAQLHLSQKSTKWSEVFDIFKSFTKIDSIVTENFKGTC